jgi:hypothetical protein
VGSISVSYSGWPVCETRPPNTPRPASRSGITQSVYWLSYRREERGSTSGWGKEWIFLFATTFRSNLWHRIGAEALTRGGGKQPVCEADYWPPSSAGVKNAYSYTSIPPYVFVALYLLKYKNTFTCIFDVTLNSSSTVQVKVKFSLCFDWAPHHVGLLGEWRYSSTHSWPRH